MERRRTIPKKPIPLDIAGVKRVIARELAGRRVQERPLPTGYTRAGKPVYPKPEKGKKLDKKV